MGEGVSKYQHHANPSTHRVVNTPAYAEGYCRKKDLSKDTSAAPPYVCIYVNSQDSGTSPRWNIFEISERSSVGWGRAIRGKQWCRASLESHCKEIGNSKGVEENKKWIIDLFSKQEFVPAFHTLW